MQRRALAWLMGQEPRKASRRLVTACTAAAGALQDAIAAYDQRDFATALRLVTPLAQSGDGAAQYRLGLLYANGEGVRKDDVLAYMWWTLADMSGSSEAVYSRDDIETEMSLAELIEAQRLAAEWRPTPAP